MSSRPLPWFHPAPLLATWFCVGLLPKAPGTWGSLAALPFAWLMASVGNPWLLPLAALLAFLAGTWAAERLERASGDKDPSHVVIDEVAGQWMTLAVLPLTAMPLDPLLCGIGFVLFRVMDITKPWPANWLDRNVSGGLGVMLDDIAAGAYAGIALYLIAEYLL